MRRIKGYLDRNVLIGIGVIILLGIMMFPRYVRWTEAGKFNQALMYSKTLASAEERYFGKKGSYTDDVKLLDITLQFESAPNYQCPHGRCYYTSKFIYSIDHKNGKITSKRRDPFFEAGKYTFEMDPYNQREMTCMAENKAAVKVCEYLGGTYIRETDNETYYLIKY